MRLVTFTALAALLLASSAGAEQYQWTISSSSTDPYSNTGAPTGGVRTLYLWLACAAQGAQCAEFDIATSGSIVLVAVNPAGLWVQIAPPPPLLFCFYPCTTAPSLAAVLTVIDLPGTLCIVPSSTSGVNATADCEVDPQIHSNAFIGYTNDGTTPCMAGLCDGPVSVGDSSWGSVKSLYR